MASYLRPSSLDEALGALAASERVIVAGATDYYPARVATALTEDVLDVSGVAELSTIVADDEGWWFPALATWSDVLEAPLPPLFDGLKAAARTIGGVQIQNRGTICGNLCNASPAADGIPNLIALDAHVELASIRGRRHLRVEDFLTGNRQTIRESDELVLGVRVPPPSGSARSAFIKLGSRSSLVISIAMVAGVLTIDPERHISGASIVVGACSPVAQRLPSLEARLVGLAPSMALADLAEPQDLTPLSPIDDIRGTAAYRRDGALTLVRRLIGELCR